MDRQQVAFLVFECLATLNRERPPADQLPVAETTALLSETSTLDSLGFVSFVTDLEDRILTQTGEDFMLASAAMSPSDNPFRTVATLIDHITAQLPAKP